MVSFAVNIPGIRAGNLSAIDLASLGDFNGKLSVKWFWLIEYLLIETCRRSHLRKLIVKILNRHCHLLAHSIDLSRGYMVDTSRQFGELHCNCDGILRIGQIAGYLQGLNRLRTLVEYQRHRVSRFKVILDHQSDRAGAASQLNGCISLLIRLLQ